MFINVYAKLDVCLFPRSGAIGGIANWANFMSPAASSWPGGPAPAGLSSEYVRYLNNKLHDVATESHNDVMASFEWCVITNVSEHCSWMDVDVCYFLGDLPIITISKV